MIRSGSNLVLPSGTGTALESVLTALGVASCNFFCPYSVNTCKSREIEKVITKKKLFTFPILFRFVNIRNVRRLAMGNCVLTL